MVLSKYQVPTHGQPFDLHVKSTALLVVDMQNDFCHPEGFNGQRGRDLSGIRSIIPQIQRVLSWAREQGIQIIFTRESHRPDLSDLTACKQVRYSHAGSLIGQPSPMGRYLIQGELGTAIIEELQPLAHDFQVDKPGHSAFVRTRLEEYLRSKGLEYLVITGVTTECCVLATYRHASDLGFFSLLLEDCCAAFNIDDHQAAIHTLLAEDGVMGWVTSSDQLLTLQDPE